MEYKHQFPKLAYFMSGYFHEFWKSSYIRKGYEPSFQDVVQSYKEKDAKSTVLESTYELEKFLDIDINEGELRRILMHDFGSSFRAPSFGMTYRQWLEGILKILRGQ
jgi:hypothetical protein